MVPQETSLKSILFPASLHDGHSDYPLAPKSFNIEPEMLFTYQQDTIEKTL